MKTSTLILVTAALCASTVSLAARTIAGPKGGRLLELDPLKAEFFVNAARQLEISFYDSALKPVPPEARQVSVVAETRSGKVALPLEQVSTGFVSRVPLPEGEPYRVVVQVRATPDAKPKNFRIDFNTAPCGECDHPEYACTCDAH